MNTVADDPQSGRDLRRWRGRLALILLVLVFALPLVTASWLYHNPGVWKPTTYTNHGQLMDPPQPLAPVALVDLRGESFGTEALRGYWTLLYVGDRRCGPACDAALVNTRQLRLALGHNMDRVQRVYLSTDSRSLSQLAPLLKDHPRLQLVTGDREALAVVLERLGEGAMGQVFLLDPLGNLLLRYGPEVSGSDMLKDVRKLLRNSRIG
ncbi:cytochrome oxidase assembly protein, Sco1/SenC family [Thioalkalivibrio nitratireducens DSM 14787]|uniref:Cytochrome oxidase assembly protein, Sco1/SenC family n=1 Tax=Thioalkalivibrio nitratireducens (strain DSM 14787 / UNIQEM 213 / ALEN2) TaxID=1255043 RepID=L0E082_THIND|nr:SCO family protein [Thioalkalivibrio nitratireducens]AGA34657.1 cytochrome oxidase assembly protein, Sco1/SenC family [Thioalkalivibrio nitratireducens DSM 14787]